MRKPAYVSSLIEYQSVVNELWGKHQIFTTAPTLAQMNMGELAFGDGTEASPAAGSDAVYFKPDAAKIAVIASDGATLATRFIT